MNVFNIKVKNTEVLFWQTAVIFGNSNILFTKIRVIKSIIVTLLALIFLLPQNYKDQAQAQAQNKSNWSNYKKVKNWTVNRYAESQSSPAPSCSAVKFIDRSNAIRIERVSDGYIFGLNGYGREHNGPTYPMSFWFDGQRRSKQSGQASFFKDAGYNLDDWLSFFVPFEDRWGTLVSLKNGNSISFEVSVPGNRTGKDLVESKFSLSGSAAALSALEECYQVANNNNRLSQRRSVTTFAPPPVSTLAPQTMSTVSDCPDDGPRLPGSGICQGRGVNHLELLSGDAPFLTEGCEWKLNEARMPNGDYLLYLAASCDGVTTQLEFTNGTHFSSVSIIKSGMKLSDPFENIMYVVPISTADPKKEILKLAKQQINDPGEAAQCRILEYGDGRFVIDKYSKEELNGLTKDGPLDEDRCGRFGESDIDPKDWRIFDGYAWYIKSPHEAYEDYDRRSLKVVKAEDLPNR